MNSSSFLKKFAAALCVCFLLSIGDSLAQAFTYTVTEGASSITFDCTNNLDGTAQIDGIDAGTPTLPGQRALITPDILTRPSNFDASGTSADLIFASYPNPPGGGSIPNYLTLPVGYLFLDTDSNTLWQFAGYLRDGNQQIVEWEWEVFNTNNARLSLDPDVSLGTTVLEQNTSQVVIYQKIANPGTSVDNWIEVNFGIPQIVWTGGAEGLGTPLTVTSIDPGAFADQTDMTSVVLPQSLTSIGAGAFDGCTELGTLGDVTAERGVFIPAAVNDIGIAPFIGCRQLTSIFVHSLSPFYSSLDGILYDKGVTQIIQYPVGKLGMAFTTPSTVTDILESAFEGNRYLVLVQTGDELTTINDRAFFASEALVQVRFGSGLTTLDDSSFESIPTLGSAVFTGDWLAGYAFGTNVFTGRANNFEINYFAGAAFVPAIAGGQWIINGQTYDASVLNVFGDFEFQDIPSTNNVIISGYRGIGGSVSIPSTILGKPVRAIDVNVFLGNTNITSVTIPNSVTSIGDNAFAGAPNLTTVNLGTGLTNIGNKAFYNCDALTTIAIPAGLTTINPEALGGCDALASINVNASNPAFSSLGGVLFDKLQAKLVQYPGGLAGGTYLIPATVMTIGINAFKENGTLASLTIPNTVTTIEDNAFDGSLLLYDVTFGTGVTDLGNSTFSNIGTLEKATFLKLQAPTMGTGVFANAAPVFEVYYMPGASGFTQPTWTISGQTYNATVLTSENNFSFTTNNTTQTVTIDAYTGTNSTVVIPATIGGAPVRAIADNVFENNLVITSVTIPSSVSTIGNSTFSGALNLTSITLGSGLTTIGTEAFQGTGITSITIPASVSNIGLGAFEDCQSLLEINVSANNQSFSSLNGVLYNRNQTSLIFYPPGAGGTEFIIPDTVLTIHDGAFKYNQNLALVEFPNTTTTINATAFQESQSLVSVRFGTGVTSLGNSAFANIPSLGSAIFFGNAPTAVGGNNTFDGASSEFKIFYLGSATGFTNPWLGKPTAQLQKFQDFLFTSSNGTVEITGFEGRPPLPGGLAQLVPDLTTRPNPNLVVANADQRSSFIFVPRTQPVNSFVLQEDTNTMWVNTGLNTPGTRWEWEVLETDDARLNLPANISPGTTVLEQNNFGPIIYQKIGGTGSSEADWIEVNFEIPDKIAGFPVTSIAAGAFAGQTLMQSIVLPESLNKIGDRAFSGCVQLGSLGLQSAQRGVFIPAAVNRVGVAPFVNCDKLTSLFVPEANPFYTSLDQILYTKNQEKLVQYPPGKLGIGFTPPPATKEILESAFEGSRFLNVINTTTGLTNIGNRAFYGSAALVQANFGSGLTALGNSSFSAIPSLGSVVFTGNAPLAANFGSAVFLGSSDNFIITYNPGSSGFTTPTWAISGQTYNTQVVVSNGEFTFSTANGTATLTGYLGTGGSIVIPTTFAGLPVRKIGDSAFFGQVGITSLIIPNSVTSIEAGAFKGATGLSSVSFANGLKTIEEEAFFGCFNLLSASLPTTLSKIGAGVFAACDRLQSIDIPASNQNFRTVDGVLFDKKVEKLIQYPAGLFFSTNADTDYEIPSTVKTIGKQAFEGNKLLASLLIPPGVSLIEEKAFYNAESLVRVTFGRGVSKIDSLAFAGISPPLNVALFYGNAPTAPVDIFQGTDPERFTVRYRLDSNFPSEIVAGKWKGYPAAPVDALTDGGFEFRVLTNNTIEITGYDNDAEIPIFRPEYTPLALVAQEVVWNQVDRGRIPTTNAVGFKVLQLDNDTVYELTAVRPATQTLPAQNVWSILIVDDLLGYTRLPVGSTIKQQNANGPIFYQKVASPGSNASDWMQISSRTLLIPSTITELPVTSIAEGAFEDATNLESIVIPSTIKSIGKNAFRGATRLGLPDGVTGNGVFLPSTLELIGYGAFSGCTGLDRILVHSSNPNYSSVDGILFNKNRTELVQYPAGKFLSANADGFTVYSVPSQTQTVAPQAFEGNANLNRIILSSSVRTIGAYAFNECSSLSSVTVGPGVISIGNFAFANNPGLSSVIFQGNAPSIPGVDVFAGRSSSLSLQFNARSTGFNLAPWPSLPIIPIWVQGGPGSGAAVSTSTGFRAVGYVEPASFNNNIGGQIQLAVSRSRIVSGVLMLGSSVSQNGFIPTATNSSLAGAMASYRFKGEMGEDGSLSVTIPRRGESDLELNLKFDLLKAPVFFKLNAGSVLTDGTLLEDGTPNEAAVVAAMIPWSRTYPAGLFAGIYNMAFDADSGAQPIAPGIGFAGLTVDARTGGARVVGVLGDGTRITGASWVLGDGTIPLWFPLYSNKGMLIGDLDLGELGNSFGAELLWSKPPGVPRSPDPDGFKDVVLTAAEGSGRFTAPSLASFNNLSVNFLGGAGSGVNFTQGFTVNSSRIVPALPNANQVRAAWNLRGGALTGTFTMSTGGNLGRFQGVILSDGTPAGLKIRGNFVLPNSSTRPTAYFGGSVSN